MSVKMDAEKRDELSASLPPFSGVSNGVRTLRMKSEEMSFERKADSPSYCFSEKVVRKRRANRPGFRAPEAPLSRPRLGVIALLASSGGTSLFASFIIPEAFQPLLKLLSLAIRIV